MKYNWEKRKGEITYYIDVLVDGVVVGEHAGHSTSDMGGFATFAEFMAGRYHDTIRTDHGPAVLAEVIAAVQARLTPGQATA